VNDQRSVSLTLDIGVRYLSRPDGQRTPDAAAAARAILKQRGIGLRHTENGWWLLYGEANDGGRARAAGGRHGLAPSPAYACSATSISPIFACMRSNLTRHCGDRVSQSVMLIDILASRQLHCPPGAPCRCRAPAAIVHRSAYALAGLAAVDNAGTD
jgi:hypothetical protein